VERTELDEKIVKINLSIREMCGTIGHIAISNSGDKVGENCVGVWL
jgi:hypothetical protein